MIEGMIYRSAYKKEWYATSAELLGFGKEEMSPPLPSRSDTYPSDRYTGGVCG